MLKAGRGWGRDAMKGRGASGGGTFLFPPRLLAVLAAIALFLLLYVIFGPTDLSPDEAHYWEWSRRPDLSCCSKGPLVAWAIRLGTGILGHTEAGVRIFAILFSLGGSLLLGRLADSVTRGGDPRVAFRAALLPQAIPLFAAGGVIFTIDSPFLLFWALCLLLSWRAVRRPPPAWGEWIGLGLAAGRRDLLRSPGPYAACLAALAAAAPVLLLERPARTCHPAASGETGGRRTLPQGLASRDEDSRLRGGGFGISSSNVEPRGGKGG